MKVIERITKAQEILNIDDAPWIARRSFPKMMLSDTGISFCNEGDFISVEEFPELLEWLNTNLAQGKKSKK